MPDPATTGQATDMRTELIEPATVLSLIGHGVAPDRVVLKADEIRGGQLSLGSRQPVPVSSPIDWSMDPFDDRSWRFKLHSWDPAFLLCQAHMHSGDAAYLQAAVEWAIDWIEAHRTNSTCLGGEWGTYDMAVGKRAVVLAYIGNGLRRDLIPDCDDAAAIERASQDHLTWLFNPKHITWHGNHGIYQLAGLLALANQMPWLHKAQQAGVFALDGLLSCFKEHYTSDGLHREHSPAYHALTLRKLCAAFDADLIPQESALTDFLSQSLTKLSWLMHPDGKVAAFGDTSGQGETVAQSLVGQSSHLKWIVSKGRDGTPVEQRIGYSEEAGIAWARSAGFAQEPSKSSYLVMQAAFHGEKPQHKHADDGTFEWSVDGRRVLIDAGKYQYQYDHPMRQYCESARAHNTVALDDIELRFKGKSNCPPAAIRTSINDDGAFMMAARMQRPTIDDVDVLHQHRVITGRVDDDNNGLLVLDHVSCKRQVRPATQWMHFHPSLKFRRRGLGLVARWGSRQVAVLGLAPWDSTLSWCRGRETPSLQGWHSSTTNAVEENDAIGIPGLAASSWFASAVLVSRDGPPRLRVVRDGERTVMSQIDNEGERPLVVVPRLEDAQDGITIHRGERHAFKLISRPGPWQCELVLDLHRDDEPRRAMSRLLALGKTAVRLLKDGRAQVVTGDSRLAIPLVDGRLHLELRWSPDAGLAVSSHGTPCGVLPHAHDLPRSVHLGDADEDRGWSGTLHHLSIRTDDTASSWHPHEVTFDPHDLVMVSGLWNEHVMQAIQDSVELDSSN